MSLCFESVIMLSEQADLLRFCLPRMPFNLSAHQSQSYYQDLSRRPNPIASNRLNFPIAQAVIGLRFLDTVAPTRGGDLHREPNSRLRVLACEKPSNSAFSAAVYAKLGATPSRDPVCGRLPSSPVSSGEIATHRITSVSQTKCLALKLSDDERRWCNIDPLKVDRGSWRKVGSGNNSSAREGGAARLS